MFDLLRIIWFSIYFFHLSTSCKLKFGIIVFPVNLTNNRLNLGGISSFVRFSTISSTFCLMIYVWPPGFNQLHPRFRSFHFNLISLAMYCRWMCTRVRAFILSHITGGNFCLYPPSLTIVITTQKKYGWYQLRYPRGSYKN